MDTKTTQDTRYVFEQPARLLWPSLFEPKQYAAKPGQAAKGEPKYEANFLIPNDSPDIIGIKKILSKLRDTNWPGRPYFLNTQEGVKITNIKLPYRDGDEVADEAKAKKKNMEFARGHILLKAKTLRPPALAYILADGRWVDLETEEAKVAAKGKFYSGSFVKAILNFATYVQDGTHGFTCYFNQVGSFNSGDRIGGAPSANSAFGSNTFKGYVGSVSTDDPTAPGASENLDDIL